MSTDTSGTSVTGKLVAVKPYIRDLIFSTLNDHVNDRERTEMIDGVAYTLTIYLTAVAMPGCIQLDDRVYIIPLGAEIIGSESTIRTIETVSIILKRCEDGGDHLRPYFMYVAYKCVAGKYTFDSMTCRIESYDSDSDCTKRFESIPHFWRNFWSGLRNWVDDAMDTRMKIVRHLKRFEVICVTEEGKVIVDEHVKMKSTAAPVS